MKIDVKEGQVLIESVSLAKVSEECFYLLVDFKSKRPELVAYNGGEEVVFEFAANEGTLHINEDGDPFTSIHIHLNKKVERVVASDVGRYTCMATLFTREPFRNDNIVIDWERDDL